MSEWKAVTAAVYKRVGEETKKTIQRKLIKKACQVAFAGNLLGVFPTHGLAKKGSIDG